MLCSIFFIGQMFFQNYGLFNISVDNVMKFCEKIFPLANFKASYKFSQHNYVFLALTLLDVCHCES